MTIQKILDLSTAHISLQTNERLSEAKSGSTPFRFARHQYGYIIFASPSFMEEEHEYADMPEILTILKYAQKNGCDYISLDADAEEDSNLETFNW